VLVAVTFGILFGISYETQVDQQVNDEPDYNVVDNYDESSYIIGPPGSAHHHSTYLIFINGKLKRFDDARYFEASRYAHIHDNSFAEIHTHAANISLGYFFKTINTIFSPTCLAFDKEFYCNNATHTLKFYVEGQTSNEFGNHLTIDWEHYLITYGDESDEEIQQQIEYVPDPRASPSPYTQQPGVSIFRVQYKSL